MNKVDIILDKFLSQKPRADAPDSDRFVSLDELEISWLCQKAKEVLLSQPNLLELDAPVKIVGDVHGQYTDMLRLFDYGGYPPEANYLFLGDYVDRGDQGIECTCLLLAFKIKYPNNFFMLRGNHECASINRMYGFYEECKTRYSVTVWREFNECFNCLPIAALISDRIFCLHGGLSPEMTSFEQIEQIKRPVDIPDSGVLCDFMWSDPERDISGWGENERGVSYVFGEDVVHHFINTHDLDLIVRAHQVVEHGYEFFAQRRLVTIFSAPNYCGEFDNCAAMMSVEKDLKCSFQVIQPD